MKNHTTTKLRRLLRSKGRLTVLLLFIGALIPRITHAQPLVGRCGTSFSDEAMYTIRNMVDTPIDQATGLARTFQVHFVIMCKSNGALPGRSDTAADSNFFDDSAVVHAMAVLNAKFGANPPLLLFENCRTQYIHDDSMYEVSDSTHFARMLTRYRPGRNVINIYVVNLLYKGLVLGLLNGDVPGANTIVLSARSGFKGFTDDRLERGLTLCHEMGHFFGLLHTNGSKDAGSSGTNEPVHPANSIIADTTGDFCGDTPADPCYEQYHVYGLPYPQISTHPCIDSPKFCDVVDSVYHPLPDNLMISFADTLFKNFTTEQRQKMHDFSGKYGNTEFVGDYDLMIGDWTGDFGNEPDYWWNPFFSQDIWNCRTANFCNLPENAGYLGGNNQLSVKVTNRSCTISYPGGDTLHAYWTLASTKEQWKSAWDSTTFLCSGLVGGKEIKPYQIMSTSIAPLSSKMFYFQWIPPNPTSYTCIHLDTSSAGAPEICYLARIVSSEDQIWIDSTPQKIQPYVLNNNNVATRNSVLISAHGYARVIDPTCCGPVLLVENPVGTTGTYDVHLKNVAASNAYLTHGDVVMTLNSDLYSAWVSGGSLGTNVSVYDAGAFQIYITGEEAVLQNISIGAEDLHQIRFAFDYETGVDSNLFQFAFFLTSPGTNCIVGSVSNMEVRANMAALESARHYASIGKPISILDMISVVPNPARTEATYTLSLQDGGSVSLWITDVAGKTVATLAEGKRYEPGTYSKSIDLHAYSAGLYFLHLKSANGIKVVKFIVNKG